MQNQFILTDSDDFEPQQNDKEFNDRTVGGYMNISELTHSPVTASKHNALKEQESIIDALKKENYSLKVKLYHQGENGFNPENSQSTQSSLSVVNPDAQIAKYKTEITRLKSQLDEFQTVQQENLKLKNQVFELNSQLSQRVVEIEHLSGENESLHLQVQSLSNQLQHTSQLNSSKDKENLNSTQINDRSFSRLSVNADSILPNHQLEQGINMLRDQISQLKMSLIEQNSRGDYLMNELETKTLAHQRSIKQLYEQFSLDEEKYKRMISQLKNELQTKQNEINHLTNQLDLSIRNKSHDDTSTAIEIAKLEKELESSRQKILLLTGEIDKSNIRINANQNELEIKKQQVDSLQRQLDQKQRQLSDVSGYDQKTIEELQAKIASLNKQLSDSQAQNKIKASELTTLRETNAKLKVDLQSIEAGYQNQAKMIEQNQDGIRQELNMQIEGFKIKTSDLNNQLQQSIKEASQLKEQLHSVQMQLESKTQSFEDEKRQLKLDVKKLYDENESLRKELSSTEIHQNDMKINYENLLIENTELKSLNSDLKTKQSTLDQSIETLQNQIMNKENELTKRNQIILEFKYQIKQMEQTVHNDKSIARQIENRCQGFIDERNRLLLNVDTLISKMLNEKVDSKLLLAKPDINEDFYKFSDYLCDKIDRLQSQSKQHQNQFQHIEQKFKNEVSELNSKLDMKLRQLSKFEQIVQDAVKVQEKLKSNLRDKQQECISLKQNLSQLQGELFKSKHKLTTVESDLILKATQEKSKTAQIDSVIHDLKNQIRNKENHIKDLNQKLQENQSNVKGQLAAIELKNQKLQLEINSLKSELESKRNQIKNYQESINDLKQRLQTQPRHSNSQQLKEASEAALIKLNEDMQSTVDKLQRALKQESNLSSQLDYDLKFYKSEYEKLKRKLEKREKMIQMALQKLELVNDRKNMVEAAIINQFSDDFKQIINPTREEQSKN